MGARVTYKVEVLKYQVTWIEVQAVTSDEAIELAFNDHDVLQVTGRTQLGYWPSDKEKW